MPIQPCQTSPSRPNSPLHGSPRRWQWLRYQATGGASCAPHLGIINLAKVVEQADSRHIGHRGTSRVSRRHELPSLATPMPGMVSDLIARVTPNARFRTLLRGDWSEYPSQSEAEAAICMHLARNVEISPASSRRCVNLDFRVPKYAMTITSSELLSLLSQPPMCVSRAGTRLVRRLMPTRPRKPVNSWWIPHSHQMRRCSSE